MRSLLLVLAVLAIAAPALAAPLAKAPRATKAKAKKPKPIKIDVAAAVASGDADQRCGAAIALAGAGDVARASLLIEACSGLPARGEAARAARMAIGKIAARDQWSPVEIVLVGAGGATAVVTIDAFADVPLGAGNWKLPAGTYRVSARNAGGEATYDLVLTENSRALVMIEPPLPPQEQPRNAVVDFGEDDGAPLDAPIAGPPTVKHGSLLPERYRKGMKQCGAMACRKAP
jgi:hypothetical protein